MNISHIRSTIPALQNTIYLNSGASAPSPHTVVEAIEQFLHRQSEEGPFAPALLEEELRLAASLREAVAHAIGGHSSEITLCSNTTDGINLVAAGMDWREGDEVLTCDQEHPSGLLPWFYLRDRFGIRVKVVTLPENGEDTARLFQNEIGSRTRLVSLSHISWCTGLLLPIREIAAAAHQHGAAVLVDGAQGPGHLPVNVKELDCDFYALSGQKWLMGPHGAGALYISSTALFQPQPSHLGWASASWVAADGSYTLHPDGRRYEYATTNHGLWAGFLEALRLYEENQPARVWDRILHLSQAAEDRIRRLQGAQMVSPRGPGLSTGLLSFRLNDKDPQEVVQHLWTSRRIVCRWVFPLAVRLSFHIFNTEEEIATLVEALGEV